MGLTTASTGRGAVDGGLVIRKQTGEERVAALAGNPNVGKSTVFNALTGMNQHTGNWPGKTVSNAQGHYSGKSGEWIVVDLPGAYSLFAHSAEEEAARDFLCFGGADAVIVVCDATCLERNLNLVLQTLEITGNVVVCVNLMDEAARKGVRVDLSVLEKRLGVPVVGTAARSGRGLAKLMEKAASLPEWRKSHKPLTVPYITPVEEAAALLEGALGDYPELNRRWAALRLLDWDESLKKSMTEFLGRDPSADPGVQEALRMALSRLEETGIPREELKDRITSCLVQTAEEIYAAAVEVSDASCSIRDRRLDRILTSRRTGTPIMLLLLCCVFWLTIVGANYPSQLLSQGLFWVQDRLTEFVRWTGAPEWVNGLLVEGVYRTLAWVVSVMLPPMAIFFPLFTLLEDFGYLPRVAFNLDHHFKKAHTCGKQALTMCMGFGCNAAGVVGCRIIDSPRERLIAVLTNSFVPCNGRFPPPSLWG